MLRLVVNNTPPFYSQPPSKKEINPYGCFEADSSPSLLFDFKEISPGIWVARFRDTLHGLYSEITLAVKESLVPSETTPPDEYFERVFTADYPSISVQNLAEKVNGDPYLQGIITVQFQLDILEQLLLFCEKIDAAFLVLNFDDADLDYLEIYRRFTISEEETITSLGEKVEITIPTGVETYDSVIDFMYETKKGFCQTLWHNQKSNPAFRNYIKSHFLTTTLKEQPYNV